MRSPEGARAASYIAVSASGRGEEWPACARRFERHKRVYARCLFRNARHGPPVFNATQFCL